MASKLLLMAPAILIVLLLIACQANEQNTNEPAQEQVSTDSLTGLWNAAWNNKDSTALANMFSENTVYLAGDANLIGRDSIMVKWVNNNLPAVANLQTVKMSEGTSDGMAYQSGTWTLDVMNNDSLVSKENGIYTFVWKKQADNSWKLEVVQL